MLLLTKKVTDIRLCFMNKVPMQIYFDPDIAHFYKLHAQRVGKSFAQVIREIVYAKKVSLMKERQENPKNKTTHTDNHPLIKAFAEAEETLHNVNYYYADRSDDELIYKHPR